MHRALMLPEILLRILDFMEVQPKSDFYAGYQQPLCQNTGIARLARTCRQLLEPCLNVLWRNQHTLGPLVKTLPEDAYGETLRTDVRVPPTLRYFHVYLTRPLLKSDWDRFDYYASRIKALGYYYNEYGDLEDISWSLANTFYNRERELSLVIVSQICRYRHSRWLLPNLTRLRWNIYDAHYTSHLPLFLGPKLTTLAFGFKPGFPISPSDTAEIREQMVQILGSLVDLCPSLRELEMYPEYASDVVVAARNFADKCQRLEGYHVDTSQHVPMDQDFIMYLAAKPALRKVYLSVDSDTAQCLPLLSSPPIYHPFPALQVLWLKVVRLHHCAPLFEAMQHCRLFSLTIEIEMQPLALDVVELFQTLRKCCAKYTLHVCHLIQRLFIVDEDVWPPTKSDHFVGIDALSPMLDFPNMRMFAFSIPIYAWLTDDDLRIIGNAWPGLVIFAFNEVWGSPTVAPATWEGIVTLTQKCPLLTELHILFDTRRNLDAVGEVSVNSRLRFFDVVNSPLPEDPAIFAQALFALAPRILQFRVSDRGPWEMEENWNAPLIIDPHAYPDQVDTIMCQLRSEYFGKEYTEDVCGATEIPDPLDSQPQEWNPWA